MTYLRALILLIMTIVALCAMCFLIMVTYEAWENSRMRKDLIEKKKRRDK